MQKKYQIFISSTFRDLIEERSAVSKIILDLDHIPAGMELFSATDMDQMSYIKQVIDQCDYYVLVVAGKYGSVAPDGQSYTELEYDYAVESGKVVLAFVFDDISNLLASQVETDPLLANKLDAFKNKVKTGRIVQFWKSQDDLAGKVALSLTKAFNRFPQVGWIRADNIADDVTIRKLNDKNEEIDKLKKMLADRPATPLVIDGLELAGLDDSYVYSARYDTKTSSSYVQNSLSATWKQIAVAFVMNASRGLTATQIAYRAMTTVTHMVEPQSDNVSVEETVVAQVLVQLELLGIFSQLGKGVEISENGRRVYMSSLAVAKSSN